MALFALILCYFLNNMNSNNLFVVIEQLNWKNLERSKKLDKKEKNIIKGNISIFKSFYWDFQ